MLSDHFVTGHVLTTSGGQPKIMGAMRTQRARQARIRKIKQQIEKLDLVRPGVLSQQFNVCGKAGCRCKQDPPQKHGPYHQVSYTRHGKSKSQFVRRENLTETKRQLRNYEKLRTLLDEWIDLSIEAGLRDK